MLGRSQQAVWGSALDVPRLSVHLSESEVFLLDLIFLTKTKTTINSHLYLISNTLL